MKKLLFVALFAVNAPLLNAQFTLRLAGGYAWPGLQTSEGIAGPIIDPANPLVDALGPLANITDTMNGKPATYKPVKGSYGKGMNFTLGLGYTVNKYFNFELGISYIKSATIACDQTRQLIIADGATVIVEPYYLFAHITSNAVGVSLSPAFTVQAPIKRSKFMPYVRAGISMPIYGGLTDHVTIYQNSGIATLVKYPYYLGTNTDVTLKTQGAPSLGINGAVGVKYNVLPYLCVFIEANGQYLTTRAKSSQITQWDADGVSLLGNGPNDRTVYRTQFVYVSQLTSSSNNAQYNPHYQTSQPKEDIGPTGAFSNLGINIGLTFNLSKKTLKKKTDSTGNPTNNKQ